VIFYIVLAILESVAATRDWTRFATEGDWMDLLTALFWTAMLGMSVKFILQDSGVTKKVFKRSVTVAKSEPVKED
jgi:hypothetical protein